MTAQENTEPLDIVIVRHGETVHNELGMLQGQFDSELNLLGKQQAAAAGSALKGEHFDACYASDLQRTMETARLALDAAGISIPITPEPDLREWHLGELQNRPHRELQVEYPELMASFKRECGEVLVPGGESRMQFAGRIEKYLRRLAGQHEPGEKILLVTHGGTMQMVFRAVVGPVCENNLKPLASNASISKIRFFHHLDSFQMVAWNDTTHLREIKAHATIVY